jgi:hypothetical protein
VTGFRREIPIACSLDAQGQAERAEGFKLLIERALVRREETVDGVMIELRDGPGVRQETQRLTEREHECCPFLDFNVESGEGSIRIAVSAPPEARPVLDALFGR